MIPRNGSWNKKIKFVEKLSEIRIKSAVQLTIIYTKAGLVVLRNILDNVKF